MPTTHSGVSRRLYLVLSLLVAVTDASTNYTTCLAQVRNGAFLNLTKSDGTRMYPSGGAMDSHGRFLDLSLPYTNTSNATAIPYNLCINECGTGPEVFNWTIFSTNFSTWLLPWLALVSQLPFGSQFRYQNILSIFLTVGSPALAAYSLMICVLNWAWVPRAFDGIRYPNVEHAWPILASLQHSPLYMDQEDSKGMLASVVALPENDKWWKILGEGLDYEDNWTTAIILQIAWVVVAFVLTVVDSFQDGIINDFGSSGKGTGTLFLWLLPLVIGWQKLSPRCDYARVREALRRADEVFRTLPEPQPAAPTIYTPFGVPEAPPFPEIRVDGLSSPTTYNANPIEPTQDPDDDGDRRSPFIWMTDDDDRSASAPIYSDSRLFPWTANVELVAGTFRAAAEVLPRRDHLLSLNEQARRNVLRAISRRIPGHVRPLNWWDIIQRCATAGALAMVLHWGTIGSAIVYSFFTPTSGLGCRSGSFVLYAAVGTLVWIIIVSSSFMVHYAEWLEYTPRSNISKNHPSPQTVRIFAKILRSFGKFLAILNALWIVTACIFLFSNFYTRCWCDSSVLSRGTIHGFTTIIPDDDASQLKGAWIGAIVLSLGSVAIFIGFVYTNVQPVGPDPYARNAKALRRRSAARNIHRTRSGVDSEAPLLPIRDSPAFNGYSPEDAYFAPSTSSHSGRDASF
ncbi:hypothetical protein PENSPDRAFT_749503 [Peniophora sp. CONT]|nr:hypothetical protein PENSPDRAFT_749503 [Peniophora sp. CONT]